MPNAVKAFDRPSQRETNYTTLSPNMPTTACANCRFFGGSGWCTLIENHPEQILPTGLCDRWESPPEHGELDVRLIDDDGNLVVQVGLGSAFDFKQIEEDKGLVSRISSAVRSLFGAGEGELSGIKSIGENSWIAFYSNNFEDREEEILSEDGHKEYVWRVDNGLVPPPALQYWHLGEAVTFGHGQMVGYDDHMAWAIGEYDDTEEGQAAKKSIAKGDLDLSMSCGFTYPSYAKKGGVYKVFNVYEISVLPRGAEANPYTDFIHTGDKEMALSDQKKQGITKFFGDRAPAVIEKLERGLKAGADVSVIEKFKNFTGVEVEAETDTKDNTETSGDAGQDVILELVEAQDLLLTKMEAIEKAFDKGLELLQAATEKAGKKEKSELSELQKSVKKLGNEFAAFKGMTPRAASDAEESEIDDEDEDLEDVEKNLEERQSGDYDVFWGKEFGVKKNNPQ